jgi:tRNA pseudouridine13 synthase
VEDLSVAGDAQALTLSFSLPKGSYAAAVLREVMKSGEPAEEPE